MTLQDNTENGTTPEVKYPRHILFIGPHDSGVLDLLKALTGTSPIPRPISPLPKDPSQPTATTAGLSHNLPLATRYYRATIPIWLDESLDPSTWRTDFLTSEAADVVRAVGAWVVPFRKTAAQWSLSRELMSAVKAAVEATYGGEGVWDGCFLCVGMPAMDDEVKRGKGMGSGYEEWEDECFDLGFEFVDGAVSEAAGGKRDAAGELQGLARLREALESNEWENVDDLGEDEEGLDFLGEDSAGEEEEGVRKDETRGFRLERTQMESEFAGLKMAMAGAADEGGEDEEGGAEQVEELERMMLRMTAARDMSAHLSEAERKRVARRTVDDIMKEM